MNKVLFTCLTAIGILLSGCIKETYNEEESEQASLIVTVQSENAQEVRASGNEPTQEMENTVFSFAVCVFDNTNGTFEKSAVFTNTLTGEIKRLNAGTKRVVVLVNTDDYGFLDAVTTYSDLDEMTINLDSQIPADFSTYGLFMSGELADVELVADTSTPVTVNVRRVAAKVRLASLTITPDAGSSLADFNLLGVCVQKVPYWTYVLGDVIPEVEDDEYIGGMDGAVSAPITDKPLLLYENLSACDVTQVIEPEVYFYVFPNNNAQGKATLLTIHGTYNNSVAYYTFPINSSTVNGGDGLYIQRNKIYTLNITLKDLRNPLTDADAISPHAVLLVSVKADRWGGALDYQAE